MKKRGIALILVFMVIAVLSILGSAVISRSISEGRIVQKYTESTQAFWVAEGGINRALNELRSSYGLTSIPLTNLGPGQYNANITHNPDGTCTVIARGFIPSQASPRVERVIQTVMNSAAGPAPLNFYNNILYSAGGFTINGASNAIRGNITYAGDLNGIPNIEPGTGTLIKDPLINPLAALDYKQLRTVSKNQGNYHDDTHHPSFPTSFWKDEAQTVPNIVFIEGNFDLTGKTKVAGFFVVGGEVAYDATLSGNVAVIGCIYTRGNFTIKGGGSALNVDGGVWVGGLTTLNGGVVLYYNLPYMTAIQNLGINTTVQIVSWKDTQSPYQLTP